MPAIRTAALLLGLAVMLTACARYEWRRPDGNDQQLARDLAGCRTAARDRSYAEVHARILAIPQGTITDPYGRSTLAPPLSAEGERIAIEESLMRNCMQQRGYVLAPQRPRVAP